MHLRRFLALATGAIVLSAVATSCGFDYATDRVYTPGVGSNNREGTVDVLAGVIVASEDNAGTFIASFANSDEAESATLETLEGSGEHASLTAEVEPVEIPAGGLVNLAEDGGIPVEGEFELGDFVSITIAFADGERASLEVPVVPNCGAYADLDGPADEELCEIPEPAEH